MKRDIFRAAALAPLLFTSAFAQTTLRVPADQPTIQAAIKAAVNGDTVLVAPGTYYENIDFKGKAITVVSEERRGGSAPSVIDAQGKGTAVSFTSGEGRDSVLEGFTIQNSGLFTSSSGPSIYAGGGIYVERSAPTFTALIVRNNACVGINSYNASPLIQNSTITSTQPYTGSNSDTCTFAGGLGISLRGNLGSVGSSTLIPTLIGNSISNNNGYPDSVSLTRGGGIFSLDADPVIENNRIFGNSVPSVNPVGEGGGINIWDGGATIVQNLIYGNYASTTAGGVAIQQLLGVDVKPVYIVNNTLVDNTAGSVAYLSSATQLAADVLRPVTLSNNVFAASSTTPLLSCNQHAQVSNAVLLDHNDFYNAAGPVSDSTCLDLTTKGNLSVDPLLTANTYLSLKGSPLVDAGSNSAFPQLASDLLGNPRIVNASGLASAQIDIGAYEYGTPAPTTTTCFLSGPISSGAFLLGATVTSQAGTPTGAVTFVSAPVTIGGILFQGKTSVIFGPPASSSSNYTATYLGNSLFAPSSCNQGGPLSSLSLASSPNPSIIGQQVTFTAHIAVTSGVPPGSLILRDGNVILTTLQPDAAGNAGFSTSTLPAGSHTIGATYTPLPGASQNTATASVTQVVKGLASTATLTATPSSLVKGSTLLLLASVAPASVNSQVPLGTVTFTVGSATLGVAPLANGSASLSTSDLPVGTDAIIATYSGDSSYSGSTSDPVIVKVQAPPTTLTVSSSVNPAPALSPILFTARLLTNGAPTPTGNTILFTISGGSSNAVQGTALTDGLGTARFSTELLAGQYTVTATFAGTASLAASAATSLLQRVELIPTNVTLSASPNPAVQTTAVNLSAAVTHAAGVIIPLGTVTFFDGAMVIGTAHFGAPLGSPATFSASALTAGDHTLTATYMPGATETLIYLPSTSAPFTETILPQDFSVAASTPSISIQTAHHKDLTLTFTSIGGFTGTLSLGCAPTLPPVLACYLPATVSLPANGTTTVTLTLETDAVRGYLASNVSPQSDSTSQRHRQPSPAPWLVLAAFTLPAGLLTRRKRRLHKHFSRVTLSVCLLLALSSLAACSGHLPDHTPPGNYTVTLTAQGTSAGAPAAISHTLPLTLTVTP